MSTQIRTVRLALCGRGQRCLEFFYGANGLTICRYRTAAKAALRRKKVQEKNLEQTTAQIAQLEQQIYSIEAANINHETLQAMKQAGAAMAQIHSGMSIDKVDETMYVVELSSTHLQDWLTDSTAGTNSENNTNSAKRSARLSPRSHSASSRTKTSWSRSWKDSSRRLWTSVCSIRVLCQSIPSWTGYQRLESRSVSSTSPSPQLCRNHTDEIDSGGQGNRKAYSRGRRRRGRAGQAARRNGHVVPSALFL